MTYLTPIYDPISGDVEPGVSGITEWNLGVRADAARLQCNSPARCLTLRQAAPTPFDRVPRAYGQVEDHLGCRLGKAESGSH